MKEKLTLSIDKEIKDKAKQCMNISQVVEEILMEKTSDEVTLKVLKEGRYYLALIPRNWIVYELSETGSKKNISYFPTITQAIIQLSRKLFEDKLVLTCKDKTIELKELISIIKDHNEYIFNLTRGL